MLRKKTFLSNVLPLLLSAILLIVMLVTVFTQATSYGLTTDEAIHDSYGQSVLEWYLTLGKDQSFLHYPAEDYEPEHGAIFDVVVAAAQRVLHNQWYVEAVITALTGVLAVIGLGLCGLELGGWWFALLAALSLWLYPRFFGAMWNNPKDIPFTMANIFVLWSVLRLLKYWESARASVRNSALVAFFLAVAVAIRVNAVVWYLLLGLLLAGWWIWHWRAAWRKKLFMPAIGKQAVCGVIICAGSFLGIMTLWPYILLNPVANFAHALAVISKYPWNGAVLYAGQIQLAVNLPRSFALVWLIIGSPPVLVAGVLFGTLLLGGWSVRKRALDLQMAVVVLSFVLPLGLIVGMHSVLYNGLRQILFLVPPLILLAVYGFLRLFAFFWQRRQMALVAALLLLICANFAWLVTDIVRLNPYQYVYFSPLAGGLPRASTQFEVDYWNTCQKGASEWLGENYQKFVSTSRPTIQDANIGFQYLTYLPANFQAVEDDPDFFIDIAPFHTTSQIATYQLIYTEEIEDVPLCKVYLNRHQR